MRTTDLENTFKFVEPQFILCKIITNLQIVVKVKYCKIFQTNARYYFNLKKRAEEWESGDPWLWVYHKLPVT